MYGDSMISEFCLLDGKFSISREIWPWSKYPTYCMGAAVLMPGSAMKSLLAACQTTPYFRFDDTYLIGLCTSKAEIAVHILDRYNLIQSNSNYLYFWKYLVPFFRTTQCRFLAGYASETPEPCYVRDSITWLTDSVDHFNESYRATAAFYKNITPCIIVNIDGTNQTSDPRKVMEFAFSRTQP
jgi:hypothetical protein